MYPKRTTIKVMVTLGMSSVIGRHFAALTNTFLALRYCVASKVQTSMNRHHHGQRKGRHTASSVTRPRSRVWSDIFTLVWGGGEILM
ncbi:hypothetical protein F4677DRAFT_434946, partial [Hypoxylon crocopeplum]